MLNVEEIRKDFPLLVKHPEIIYLDNAATTLKPKCVIDAELGYYEDYCANPHSEDYGLSQKATEEYERARAKVAKFINAETNEVCFTSGDTQSMNLIAQSIGETLNEDDEVLITIAEHASNVLPWFKLSQTRKIKVGYMELDKDGRLTLENVKKAITPQTKIISIAHVTNVLGFIVDVKAICEYAHKLGILVVVDGAQSVPHIKTDVKDLDCDFLCFSAHKLCGPTGVGVLYGKYDLLKKYNPPSLGGGSNTRFDTCGNFMLLLPPHKFEPGTPNVAGVIGFGAAVDYISKIGIENIAEYEENLKTYAIEKLSKIDGIKIYNMHSETGIVTFNYKDVFAQDMATHLSSHNICVRSGQHCAKILLDFLHTTATVRASISFYNTKEEIDKLVEAVKTGDEFLNAFFI